MGFYRQLSLMAPSAWIVTAMVAAASWAAPAHAALTTLPRSAPFNHFDFLNAVSGTSSTDIWTVGSAPGSPSTGGVTLVEHWNGKRWRVVPSPNPPNTAAGSELDGVVAVSPSDAWAVGFSQPAPDVSTHALIEHWNGKKWTLVPCPSPGGPILDAVAATSASDAWAVGLDVNGALIEHWNGKKWTLAQSAPLGFDGYQLNAVSATSRTNAWSVGFSQVAPSTLNVRWNGKKWSFVRGPNPSPGPFGGADVLNSVTAISPTNAWAVGNYVIKSQRHTLIVHWNGRKWTRVNSLPPANTQHWDSLNAIAGTSTNLWAVGTMAPSSRNSDRTLIEHWNGTRWAILASPSPTSRADTLTGVYVASANAAWAVGSQLAPNGYLTLIEHWNGHKWSTVTSPSP